MLQKHCYFLSFIGGLLLLIACDNSDKEVTEKNTKPQGMRAEGYVLQEALFQQDYSTSGSLLPNESLEIHPEITGRVVNIHFREGSYVRQGQVLVSLYDADIRAQIQKLKTQRALQNKLMERQQELVKIGGISQQDFDATRTAIATIDADIAIQEAALRRTKIIAPFSGIVGIRNISEGAIVSPASTIAVLQQVNPLKMDFAIPQQYHDNIEKGEKVYFHVTGKQESFSGTVHSVNPGADAMTRTVMVRAIVPNPDNQLIPGSFADVKIPFESDDDALLIPTQAVIPTTRDKKVVLLQEGKATYSTVKLGTRLDDKVEILEGLKAGDTILTTGLMQVKEGIPVTITNFYKKQDTSIQEITQR